jgi:hypothetical protein
VVALLVGVQFFGVHQHLQHTDGGDGDGVSDAQHAADERDLGRVTAFEQARRQPGQFTQNLYSTEWLDAPLQKGIARPQPQVTRKKPLNDRCPDLACVVTAIRAPVAWCSGDLHTNVPRPSCGWR